MIPKFRAFYEGKMYGVKAVIWTSRGLYVTLDEGNKAGRRVRGAKLMQSTGLFDVNGKEIFEGDVVKFNDTWNEYDYEGYVDGASEGENFTEILKTENGFSFGRTKIPESSVFYFLNDEHMKFSEIVKSDDFNMVVIGNIYENPELVEG
ncbi:YopX family protein [Streptococcus suis]|uniref:YopX family protein n=1 Tax=Streptococcus suis TaxID=1307 RepID=UPI0024128633|nr:YopX family protein [Streptococcus suis]MDG4506390.1 YopX family protein [Streptococcus suis]